MTFLTNDDTDVMYDLKQMLEKAKAKIAKTKHVVDGGIGLGVRRCDTQ